VLRADPPQYEPNEIEDEDDDEYDPELRRYNGKTG
jgi:hypothetical protein